MPRWPRSSLRPLLLVALTAVAAAPPPATAPCNADAACAERASAASAAAKAWQDSPQGATLHTGETDEERQQRATGRRDSSPTPHNFEDGYATVGGEVKTERSIPVATQATDSKLRTDNRNLKTSSATLEQRASLTAPSSEPSHPLRRGLLNAVLLSPKRVARAVTNEQHVAQSVGLHVAALGGRVEELRQLIRQVEDIGCGNKDDRTELHWAAITDQLKAMRQKVDSVSVLLTTIIATPSPLVATIAPAPAPPPQAAVPAAADRTPTPAPTQANTLAKVPPSRKLTEQERRALSEKLLEAAEKGRVEDMRQLIGQGADVRYKNKDGDTALHWAARNGQVEAMLLLIDSGTPVDAADKFGTNSLHWAASEGHAQSVEALAAAGADINSRNLNTGWTALHYASHFDKEGTVRALLKLGADPSIRDNEGKTARDVAKSDSGCLRLPL